jgi:hypothetical protein
MVGKNDNVLRDLTTIPPEREMTPSGAVVVGLVQNWASFHPSIMRERRQPSTKPTVGGTGGVRPPMVANENDPTASINDEMTKRTCFRTPTETSC